jgi:hypothetical protein
MTDKIRVKRRAKGARPYFFPDPTCDKLLSIVMALAGEMSVLHDRIDTMERLIEEGELPRRDAIEGYVPPAGVRAERDEWREEFLNRVLRVVHAELEAGPEDTSEEYEAAVQFVSR